MTTRTSPSASPLAEHARRFSTWGIVAGLLATLTGALCLIWPTHSISALALLLAGFLLVSGFGTLVVGLRQRGRPGASGTVAGGVVNLALGLLIAWHPGMSGGVIVIAMGLAVLLVGVLLFWLSLALRVVTGAWLRLLSVSAVICLAVGLVFLISPGFGVAALGMLLGAGAVLAGLTLIAAGVQLRRLGAGRQGDASLGAGSVVIEGTVVDPDAPGESQR